jgi:hypothetical protein
MDEDQPRIFRSPDVAQDVGFFGPCAEGDGDEAVSDEDPA